MRYDLAVVGGDVLDVRTGLRRTADLGWSRGRLAAIGDGIDSHDAAEVVSARGDIVVPGFIDLHTHVFEGIGESVSADEVCLRRGTTTAVDGGTAGARTIRAFHRVSTSSRTRVLAWLNLSTIGIIDTRVGELIPGPYLDPEAAIAAARSLPDFVVGFKARLSTYAAGGPAARILSVLREVADETELPVIVHIGDTMEPLADIVGYLRAGDVVTHALTGRNNGILDVDGHVVTQVVEAQRRGIVFDAARGRSHLSFSVLTAAVDQGFIPDTLSTDMTASVATDPGYGQSVLGSYLLAAGVPIEAVLERLTSKPAAVLRISEETVLEPGRVSDATIVRVETGTFEMADVDGRLWRMARRLVVVGAIRLGAYYRAVGS